MHELMDGYRLRKRRAKNAPVLFVGHFTEAQKDMSTHTWTIERRKRFWHKPESLKVHGILAHELEAVLARGKDGRAAGILIARSLLAIDAVDRAWAQLAAGNIAALQVELTTHRSYSYQRERRTLAWRDDLTAPTPPAPGLKRRRELRPLLGNYSQRLSVPAILRERDTEQEYNKYATATDVEILRPDLFVEIEPFVTKLMQRGQEAVASLKTARAQAKDLIWEKEKESQERRARVQIANVAVASDAVAALDRAYEAPGAEILKDQAISLEQDRAANAEGDRVWRNLS